MKYGYWNSSWILRILVSTTALILLVSAAPSLGADGLTLLQLSKLRSVTEAVISPDGSLIATVLDVPRVPGKDKDGPSWKELHLVDAKTGESRPFITGEVNVRSVQWAGGMHLSYLAKRGEDKYTSLYMIAVNGGESKRKLSLESSIESYAWSVDLTAVAVIASEPRTAEEKKLREQGFTQEVYEEDWKPRRVYIASAFDSMKPRRMMIQGAPFQVRWSPDGQRIAVGVSRTPLVDDRYMATRLFLIDVASATVDALIDNPGKIAPTALNIATDNAKGDVIARVDGHLGQSAIIAQSCQPDAKRSI